MHNIHLYVAGLGNADIDTVLKSAGITTILFAIASALSVLYIYRKK